MQQEPAAILVGQVMTVEYLTLLCLKPSNCCTCSNFFLLARLYSDNANSVPYTTLFSAIKKTKHYLVLRAGFLNNFNSVPYIIQDYFQRLKSLHIINVNHNYDYNCRYN